MLSFQPKPTYEAQVSRALIRLRRVGAGDVDRQVTSAPAGVFSVWAPNAKQASVPAFYRRIALRQDGKRPRILHGALLMQQVDVYNVQELPELSVTCTVRLYLGPKGMVTVHVHLEPGPDTPLRPIWHVKDVTTRGEIGQLVDGAVFAFSTLASAIQAPMIRKMSDQVRASHPSFFARV